MNRFEIVGPEAVIQLPLENNTIEWIQTFVEHLKKVVILPSVCLGSTRKGSYIFGFEGKQTCEYDGEWKDGMVNGQGQLTVFPSQVCYVGYWNSKLGLGYGSKSAGKKDKKRKYLTWEFTSTSPWEINENVFGTNLMKNVLVHSFSCLCGL
eukprot:TRINITY_DN10016_c0_g1_i4.p1 TRINITY_DN10016_c0_g1~~TRINITY_DN10016_c0_g1_i4.p1  ORF type:complete len:151 (+),score=23.21 TRINITY_DN10016_c0_g1_i4:287-739(+)